MDSFFDEAPLPPSPPAVLGTDFYTPNGWKSEVLDHARALAELVDPARTLDWLMCDHAIYMHHVNSIKHFIPSPIFRREKVVFCRALNHNSAVLLLGLPTAQLVRAPYNEPKQIAFDFDLNIAELAPVFAHDQSFEITFEGQTLFLPSMHLCEIWSQSISNYIENSRHAEKIAENFEAPDGGELQEQFASKFQRMIATVANARAREEVETTDLSDGVQFTLDFQHEIMDRFFIDPTRQSSFLFQLHIELRNYLAGGGKIQGKWGQMIVQRGCIKLQCNERVITKLPMR